MLKNKNLPYFEGNKIINTHHFSTTANYYKDNGKYSPYREGQKEFIDFWDAEAEKCLYGVTIGEVRVTGYHYFFLNFCPMDVIQGDDTVGELSNTFPSFMLFQWQIFNIIEHCEKTGYDLTMVKVRGCGLSEIASSMGARDFALPQRGLPRSLKGKGVFKKVFYFASREGHLIGDGVLTKCFNKIEFVNQNTQRVFTQLAQNSNNVMERRASYKERFTNNVIITGGMIKGIIIDKPDKVRGNRGYKLFFEEAGDFVKLKKALNIALPLVRVGGKKFGTIIAWGTSNEDVSNIEGLKDCIYNPSAFNMLKFRNVWSDPNESEENLNKCINYELHPEKLLIDQDSAEPGVGWFVPVYMNMNLDKDGNPDVLKSIKSELKERNRKLFGQANSDALSYIGDHPFTIKEALVKGASKEFDHPKLINHYVNMLNGTTKPYYERGTLDFEFLGKTKEVIGIKWTKNPEGNIWIHEHPIKDKNGMVYKNLYAAGCDSINKGNDETITKNRSNLALLVKKRVHPEMQIQDTNNLYVAMYNYRSDDVEDDFSAALKIVYYYGCNLNIEDSMTLIKNFFVRFGMGHRLIKKPMAVRKDTNSEKESNFVGTPATETIIKHYVQRIKDYIKYYADTIPFLVMVEQIKDWNYEEKGKFDLVAAMGMTEIFGEDLDNKGILASYSEEENIRSHIGYYKDADGYRKYGVIPLQSAGINMPKPQKHIRMIDVKQNRIIFAGEEDNY